MPRRWDAGLSFKLLSLRASAVRKAADRNDERIPILFKSPANPRPRQTAAPPINSGEHY